MLKLIIKSTLLFFYFLSGLVPRKKNIWIFGSHANFNDNSKYLFLFVKDNIKDIRPIWIAKNNSSVNLARDHGGEAYNSFSLKGFFYSFIAKTYIYSCFPSEINFYCSRNSNLVNLWHGVPLKKIEFDIKKGTGFNIYGNANLRSKIINFSRRKKPDLLLSPSEYVFEYSFKSAFRIGCENVVYAMYPRVDNLISIAHNIEDKEFNKIFLYAPTWRDNNTDIFIDSKIDLQELNNLLKNNNSILLLKFHYLTKVEINSKGLDNIRVVDPKTDINKVLSISDCLITDYSSTFYDYLYLDRPIIFFPYDIDEYVSCRDLYFNYKESLPGNISYNYVELLNEIILICTGIDNASVKRKEVFDSLKFSYSGNDKIVEAIKKIKK